MYDKCFKCLKQKHNLFLRLLLLAVAILEDRPAPRMWVSRLETVQLARAAAYPMGRASRDVWLIPVDMPGVAAVFFRLRLVRSV